MVMMAVIGDSILSERKTVYFKFNFRVLARCKIKLFVFVDGNFSDRNVYIIGSNREQLRKITQL